LERTVPSTVSEEIELYLRTYYSLLRSTAEVHIRTLEEAHARMNSLLHPDARERSPDMSAFIYCLLRLPAEMRDIDLVVLGQSTGVFTRGGFGDIETWQPVSAPARRRRCFYDGKDTLACVIASRTDIDDVIPLLTAYQIEWNKLHHLLQNLPAEFPFEKVLEDPQIFEELAQELLISAEDLRHLSIVWGDEFQPNLKRIAHNTRRIRVRLLSGSLSEYNRATRIWWDHIKRSYPEWDERPVYFISSNSHSIVNLVSGYAWQYKDELISFLQQPENEALMREWQEIQADRVPSSLENFLYYVFKKYQQASGWESGSERGSPSMQKKLRDHEQICGIHQLSSQPSIDMHAQIIELHKLRLDCLDPRLNGDQTHLRESDALILNIDYPLGLAAYNILSKVAENVREVLGVYIMGKAATLNGVIGDILIPNVVHDEQSQNTYLFTNCFNAADVSPYLVYGTVLDNQKAVTVRGTFLQNTDYMDVFYREGYTDIEMEAGPYLSAVYEMHRPKRHPVNEIVSLHGLPFDLGLLHYASDTPLSKGRNLGAGSLSYYGVDSTYAASLAILRQIFELERKRLQNQRRPRG
jgi:hypothetical protein